MSQLVAALAAARLDSLGSTVFDGKVLNLLLGLAVGLGPTTLAPKPNVAAVLGTAARIVRRGNGARWESEFALARTITITPKRYK